MSNVLFYTQLLKLPDVALLVSFMSNSRWYVSYSAIDALSERNS